jgi:hypothetical protein
MTPGARAWATNHVEMLLGSGDRRVDAVGGLWIGVGLHGGPPGPAPQRAVVGRARRFLDRIEGAPLEPADLSLDGLLDRALLLTRSKRPADVALRIDVGLHRVWADELVLESVLAALLDASFEVARPQGHPCTVHVRALAVRGRLGVAVEVRPVDPARETDAATRIQLAYAQWACRTMRSVLLGPLGTHWRMVLVLPTPRPRWQA